MTTLEALDHFDCVSDPAWWPVPHEGDQSSLLMAAAASLSGQLEECCCETELKDAVTHFVSLLEAGIFTNEQWVAEGLQIEDELMSWGRAADADARRQAESN
jgi:hypothetical protein